MAGRLTEEEALSATRDAVEQILRDRNSQAVSRTIEDDMPLYAFNDDITDSLDLDSLDALDLLTLLEERLGVQLPDDFDFSTIHTIRDVASLIVVAS